jgi:hypothetical protein
MRTSDEDVASARAFRRGSVPMWKTAGGRKDGQDQKGRQLADALSSPVHVSSIVLYSATHDRFQGNCNRRLVAERDAEPGSAI